MTDRYAVIGHPVAHSLSPRIHAAFAAATRQDLCYELLPAPPDAFAATAAAFFAAGGAGLNVTVPFKEEAAGWVDELDGAARQAGAVNTIVRRGTRFAGYNTDGPGLVQDLTANCGVALTGARVLLVGAGGAARGVVGPLLAERPERLVIANRTAERARALAEAARPSSRGSALEGGGFDSLGGAFDLIVNATSAGLDGDVPPIPAALVRGAVCYDMLYDRSGRAAETAFCRWAAAAGAARTLDGLGMLVEQAALAFELWRDVRPATGPVLEWLRRGADGGVRA
ncbi:MAG TPA: shikimate dehydrogenase [Pseudomonadales bacterium]